VSLDPHRHNDFYTTAVLANVYDGLTGLDAALRVGPELATTWETPDDLTWLFHLRAGARFHDGRPVTAADVVFSLERAARLPGSDVASYLVAVKAARAMDPRTVEIRTDRPAATLLAKLAFVAIVPSGSPDDISQPVGTGSYALASWEPGKRVTLRAFDASWRGAPGERDVELIAVPDEAERVRLLASGGLDIAAGLTPVGAARVKAAPGCRVVAQDSLLVRHLEMRVDRPPFSDLRVRQAIDLAVDRTALVNRLLLGQGRVSGQMVTQNDIGFAPDIVPAARDLPRARALLAAAGYPGGFDVDLEYRQGFQGIELLRGQLAEAGIRTRPVARTWEDLYGRFLAGRAVFQLVSALAESGDASDLLDPMIHSRGTVPGYGGSNFSGYANRGLDELIETSATTLDPLERREALQRGMRIVAHDLPIVPLFVPFDLYGLRDSIVWRPRLDAVVLAADVRRRKAT
jgi:peptide/nickel transport system substrate-binding protein